MRVQIEEDEMRAILSTVMRRLLNEAALSEVHRVDLKR